MKKHPVDEIFARKLADWEPKASSDLWKRIEERQQKPSRRLGGWYWYAAAGVSIAVLAGYLVWQGEVQRSSNGAEQRVAQRELGTTPKKEVEKLTIPYEKLELVAQVKTTESKSRIRKGMSSAGPKTSKPTGERKSEVLQKEPIPVFDKVEIAAIPREEIRPETEIGVNRKLGVTPEVEVPTVNNGGEEPTKTRVIIAHIPTTEEADQDDQKSSKLLRVLRQLKNAKEGEAVDWDVVGFNPKKLMARADQRLRNEEEKLSKQYQNLKEKTKL